MRTRPLGNTLAHVSVIGLGVMPLTLGRRPSEAAALRVIHAAFDAGIDWLDTADSYCESDQDVGYGERLAALAIARWSGQRESIRVATKGGFTRPSGRWVPCGRPEHLERACEASLRALGRSSIFLYQLHHPDPDVPFTASVGALGRLEEAGKIQNIGLSNVDAAQLRQALSLTEIQSVQNRCNPFDRRSLSDGVLKLCEKHHIAFIAHSPLGGLDAHSRTAENATLGAIAARHGRSPYQIALAWLLERSPCTLPIPGASRESSATSSAEAADIAFTAQDHAELAAAFPATSFVGRRLMAARREVRHLVRGARAQLQKRRRATR